MFFSWRIWRIGSFKRMKFRQHPDSPRLEYLFQWGVDYAFVLLCRSDHVHGGFRWVSCILAGLILISQLESVTNQRESTTIKEFEMSGVGCWCVRNSFSRMVHMNASWAFRWVQRWNDHPGWPFGAKTCTLITAKSKVQHHHSNVKNWSVTPSVIWGWILIRWAGHASATQWDCAAQLDWNDLDPFIVSLVSRGYHYHFMSIHLKFEQTWGFWSIWA